MTDARDGIRKILDEYNAKQAANIAKKQEDKMASDTADRQFQMDFAELRRTVIRPVMEQICAVLKEKGHDGEIVEHNGRYTEGSTYEPDIMLKVDPKGPFYPFLLHEKHPYVRYAQNTYRRKVGISRNTKDFTDADFALAELTAESIQSQLTEFIRETFDTSKVR